MSHRGFERRDRRRPQTALRLDSITYVAGRTLLDDVSVTFPAGKVTALSGPQRLGQDHAALHRRRPAAGDVGHRGARRPRTCGPAAATRCPRSPSSSRSTAWCPILSARENVSIALRARGTAPADADEAAEAALARFGIADLGERQVEELSGGQMQRVACARGFVVGADVLLADEPTSELDEGNRGVVLAELREEAARGAVVVVATHDPAVVEACDLHIALDEGRVDDVERESCPARRLESSGCPDDAGADDRGRRRRAR